MRGKGTEVPTDPLPQVMALSSLLPVGQNLGALSTPPPQVTGPPKKPDEDIYLECEPSPGEHLPPLRSTLPGGPQLSQHDTLSSSLDSLTTPPDTHMDTHTSNLWSGLTPKVPTREVIFLKQKLLGASQLLPSGQCSPDQKPPRKPSCREAAGLAVAAAPPWPAQVSLPGSQLSAACPLCFSPGLDSDSELPSPDAPSPSAKDISGAQVSMPPAVCVWVCVRGGWGEREEGNGHCRLSQL